MKYSHKYSKLDKKEYTTIRRYSKAKLNDIVREMYPGGFHYAKVYKIQRKSFNQMSDDFIFNDTDCNNREEAIKLFNSFYKKILDENEKLYIYFLRKL